VSDEVVREMREGLNRLRGHLFGAIESWGLPEKQTNGAKSVVRNLTYAAQADLEQTLREKPD
jgi:hypothetical protein